MGERRRTKKRTTGYREFVGIEPGLEYANEHYISLDRKQAEINKEITGTIVRKLIGLMRKESPTFDYLYEDVFFGGSAYENLKITAPDEFDIDVLMRIPEVAGPVLLENNIPGYVNLQLETFHDFEQENPEVYEVMQTFVDEKNYLLTKQMKESFMQSVFDRTVKTNFPDNIIRIGRNKFKISRVQHLGPAFTLTIEGPDFRVSVDLVPCILLDEDQWPGEAFKSNPYRQPSDFFIVPKSPKEDLPHIDRYWRLSFQKQERKIIFDRQWMKPAIRIHKRIRDRFNHKVSSYAIKTIFMRQLEIDNPDLDEDIPALWLSPLSYCVVYMLMVYLKYLERGEIPYFWNAKLDLLDNLTDEQIDHYRRDIQNLLLDVKQNPVRETILKYLR